MYIYICYDIYICKLLQSSVYVLMLTTDKINSKPKLFIIIITLQSHKGYNKKVVETKKK